MSTYTVSRTVWQPAASERALAPSIAVSPAAALITPPSIHAMGSTYVRSTLGAAFGTNAVVMGARVRDAKQAAPPRGELH